MSNSIQGKRILAVDDEPDVGKLIQTLLRKADVDIAQSYEEARTKLTLKSYDVVILDIMGVDGHALLEQFSDKFPCIMLTAHALTPYDLSRSVRNNAVLYLPKDELSRLEEYIERVLDKPTKKNLWRWLFSKVDFRRYFGADWLDRVDLLEGLTMEDIVRDLEGPRLDYPAQKDLQRQDEAPTSG